MKFLRLLPLALLASCSTGGFIHDGSMTVQMPTDILNDNDYTKYSFKSPGGYAVEWERHRANQTKIIDAVVKVQGIKSATKAAGILGGVATDITKEVSE